MSKENKQNNWQPGQQKPGHQGGQGQHNPKHAQHEKKQHEQGKNPQHGQRHADDCSCSSCK